MTPFNAGNNGFSGTERVKITQDGSQLDVGLGELGAAMGAAARGPVPPIGFPMIWNAPYMLGIAASSLDPDATEKINAAIVYATDQKRTVRVDDIYQVDGVLLQNNTRIEQTNASCELRQKDNGTGGAAAATVSLANPQVLGIIIEDLRVNGNRANQTIPITGIHLNSGDTTDQGTLRRHRVMRPYIRATKGDGFKVDLFARDSLYDGVEVYFADQVGISYSGSDSRLLNFNVAQSSSHGVIVAGSNAIIANGKSWGSGRYSTGTGGSGTANFWFQSGDVEAMNLVSQESTGRGFYWFRSGQTINGFMGHNLVSDGDQIASNAAINGCFDMFTTQNSRIEGSIKKASAGLAGTPQTFVKLEGTTSDNVIRVTAPDSLLLAGTPVLTVGAGPVRNDIEFNGARGKYTPTSFAANYTPTWVSQYTREITLTGNITVNAPAIFPPVGARITMVFIQDATGGRTITLNAVYQTRASWTPNTAANGVSVWSGVWNGTAFIQVTP